MSCCVFNCNEEGTPCVYDCCLDQRCRHYRCEHMDEGCMNADCPCESFKEPTRAGGHNAAH
jgi:hypothetical protein